MVDILTRPDRTAAAVAAGAGAGAARVLLLFTSLRWFPHTVKMHSARVGFT